MQDAICDPDYTELSMYISVAYWHISVPKKKLGSICDTDYPDLCLDENALCEEGTCKCQPNFFDAGEPVCSMYFLTHLYVGEFDYVL